MKSIEIIVTAILISFPMNVFASDLVSIDGYYIIDRSSLKVTVSDRVRRDNFHVDFYCGDGLNFKFSCQEKFDPQKKRNITSKIREYLSKNNDIMLTDMLESAGLTGCKPD